MKKLLILFGIVLCIGLSAQPGTPNASGVITPGPPDWVTGAVPGDGELKLQFQYLDDRTDSLTSFIDPSDSTAVFTTIDVDSAVITVLNYDPPHGALNFSDSTTVIALTQNVWTKITGPGGDLFVVRDQDDMTIAGDTITIEVPGDYMTWVSFSFDGVQNANFHIAIYVNGVITDWEMHRKTSAQDTGNMGMPAYIKNLVAGDDISMCIENTGNDGDATMISGQWTITMLHPD